MVLFVALGGWVCRFDSFGGIQVHAKSFFPNSGSGQLFESWPTEHKYLGSFDTLTLWRLVPPLEEGKEEPL